MATPGDSNLDNIIKKNFMTEIQQSRVKNEIQALKELDQNCFKVSLQSSPLGLKIIVNLTKDYILKEFNEAKKFTFPILFEFLLEPKFPFVFPKLFCKTSFCTPSLADGRDFVFDVIRRMWNPSIMLRDIVIFIPDFLKRVISLQIPEESQLMGQYYLGHLYNLEDFLTMDSVHVFAGTEMINEQSVNNERYFVLAESYFLNFQSIDKVKNTLRLIGWAHIHSIAKVRRNAADEKMLVFLWRDSNRKGILIQNIFIIEQAKQFLTMFTQLAKKYADCVDNIKKLRDLPLSEVTAKSYRNMDIDELLGNIEFLENKLEAELNIDVVNLLMNLYQKAVEYYSALNDPTYSQFMQKLHILLTREDIQIILKSVESDQPGYKSTDNEKNKQQTQEKVSPNKRKEIKSEVPVANPVQVQQKEKYEKRNQEQAKESVEEQIQEKEKQVEKPVINQEEKQAEKEEKEIPKQVDKEVMEQEEKEVKQNIEPNLEQVKDDKNRVANQENQNKEKEKTEEKPKEILIQEIKEEQKQEEKLQPKENESEVSNLKEEKEKSPKEIAHEEEKEEIIIEQDAFPKDEQKNEELKTHEEKVEVVTVENKSESKSEPTQDEETREEKQEPKEELKQEEKEETSKTENESHNTNIPNITVANNDDMFDIGDDDD